MRTQRMPSAERRSTEVSLHAPCTFIARDQEIHVPQAAWTLEGFRAWATSPDCPSSGRFSYIGGELFIDMSPEEFNTHNAAKSEIGRVIGNINAHEDLGHFLADRMLVTNADADLSTEPDAGLLLHESLKSGKVRMIGQQDESGRFTEVVGSPDWLLEIISKHSVRKDTKLLRERYHRARVDEYWLVNALGRRIKFQIFQWGQKDYVLAPRRGEWQRSAIFGRYFRIERQKSRSGFWIYRLYAQSARKRR